MHSEIPRLRFPGALLAFEWKQYGLIYFFETPGPLR
jgi:hypothetical protein